MTGASIDDEARWKAVKERRRDADGDFYCCVKTTGVYCRPSCAGRPLRENVFFVATKAEAERAGMRPCKRCRPDRLAAGTLSARIAGIDWERASASLNQDGFALLGRLLADEECEALRASYLDADGFRSKVTMARHGFGAGEYKYYSDPLPPLVAELRRRFYARLAPLASDWRRRLGGDGDLPADHDAYRAVCAAAGQALPTPLLLSYGAGDYNRLHRDLYGGEIFPIQLAILLSEPGKDFEGGEFVLTEQRARMQSRVHVPPLNMGDALAFCVSERPVAGRRGEHRATMRHGVSTVRFGKRMVLGIIFHDAA